MMKKAWNLTNLDKVFQHVACVTKAMLHNNQWLLSICLQLRTFASKKQIRAYLAFFQRAVSKDFQRFRTRVSSGQIFRGPGAQI